MFRGGHLWQNTIQKLKLARGSVKIRPDEQRKKQLWSYVHFLLRYNKAQSMLNCVSGIATSLNLLPSITAKGINYKPHDCSF